MVWWLVDADKGGRINRYAGCGDEGRRGMNWWWWLGDGEMMALGAEVVQE